jgi:glucosamine--fructose-6-phosphate aminotransferase (isomerizing)
VKLLGNLPDPLLAEIAGQPDALRRAADALGDQQAALRELGGRAGRASPLAFSGMGSSYDACYAPVTVLGGAGVAAVMADAAEVLHFRRATLGADALVVVVSQSGRSAEVVRLAEALRAAAAPPFLVSVTNGLENPLAGLADLALDTRAGDEHGPSTMTFAASLVTLAGVARVLGGETDTGRVAAMVRNDAERAAASIETMLDRAEDLAGRLAAWLEDRPVLALLGRGTARAASEMGALMLKGAARFPAESLEAAQFRHGPLELAGAGTAVALVATEVATRDLDLGLADELAGHGTAVLVVSSDGAGPDRAERVAVGDLDRLIAPAAGVVPLQLLSWRLAVNRGREPGAYTIASKVTTHE